MSTASPIATTTENPFAQQRKPLNAVAEAESQRAITETQGAIIVAQRFPRDPVAAMDRILQAFTRKKLAETALYSYARGGTDITGPSIRAAETIAQSWGNMQYGVRELDQRPGESTVEAFAWDVETNTRTTKVFNVKHVRDTKRGRVYLEDQRDIYELIANQGARRLRACILQIVPGDVVEAAIAQAEATMRSSIQITPELIASTLEKFAEIGVPRHALEARIQRRIEAVTPGLLVHLGKIYNSIKDGMSAASDWFDLAPKTDTPDDPPGNRADKVAAKVAEAAAKTAEQKTPEQTAADETPSIQLRALRKRVTDAWKMFPEKDLRNLIKAEFGKSLLGDCTAEQLEILLVRAAAIAPTDDNEGA